MFLCRIWLARLLLWQLWRQLSLFLPMASRVKVFETLPFEFQINWLFNASDIGVIVVFLFRGVVAMWKAEGDE
jgi:hypothetical protein